MARLRHFVVSENGQDLTEYGLLVVLASLVVISLQQQLASAIVTAFTNVSNTLA